jgi:hypothetical protein
MSANATPKKPAPALPAPDREMNSLIVGKAITGFSAFV